MLTELASIGRSLNHLIRRADMGTEKQRAQGRPKQSQEHIDDLLDEALEETFPASDAVSGFTSNITKILRWPSRRPKRSVNS